MFPLALSFTPFTNSAQAPGLAASRGHADDTDFVAFCITLLFREALESTGDARVMPVLSQVVSGSAVPIL